MKILQINSVCGYGSTGRIATDLYDVLIKEGHECLIAYGRGKASEQYNTVKIGNNLDMLIHVIKTRLFNKHGFGSKRATRKFIKHIDKYNPDIIHLHNLHGYYINIEILFRYLSKKNIPIVWLLHDQWSISAHSAFITNDPLEDRQESYPSSWLKINYKSNINEKKELFTSVNVMRIVTPSIWLKKLVEQSFLEVYPTTVIYNGIDLNNFYKDSGNFKEKYKIGNKKVILGVSSVWEERKGLKIFSRLANDLTNDFQLVLVGINKKQKKKVPENILCIERTNNIKELASIYSSADFFINPTYEDNFPTTNIESLACGTPVVTFDTGGSSESVTNETGKVIEKNDYETLLRYINNYDYNEKKVVSDKCIIQSKNFDKNDVYKKYIDLYKNLLNGNGGNKID